MPLLKPDPTIYPSPRLAMQAPPEKHAFVAALNPQFNVDLISMLALMITGLFILFL